MPANCAYSFSDLFRAAYGREPERTELERLYSLSQNERNEMVREWVKLANWSVEDIRGSDGVIYASFGPAPDSLCK